MTQFKVNYSLVTCQITYTLSLLRFRFDELKCMYNQTETCNIQFFGAQFICLRVGFQSFCLYQYYIRKYIHHNVWYIL